MQIFDFITTEPALTVIILLVIYIVIREIGIKNIFSILGAIRGTQKEKYPEIKDDHMKLLAEFTTINKTLAAQNEKFATNHALHEIPDIKRDVTEIKGELKGIVAVQTKQGLDIATLLERSKK